MPDKKKLLEELNWVTDKISSQTWILNLGVLGTTWSLLISGAADKANAAKLNVNFLEVRWIFVLCLLGLLCDVGQYLSAYILGNRMLKTMEAKGLNKIEYDAENWLYQARAYCFRAKLSLTAAAACLLIVKLFTKLA